MHQVRLTPRELLSIAEINVEAMKSARRRHQIAIAFGGDDIVTGKMYLPVDACALLLSSTLARTYGASLAASLVRASADVVLIAGAQAEASKNNVPFAIVDLVRGDTLGARADLIFAEMLDEISEAAQWLRCDGFSIAMIEAAWPDADDGEVAQ